MNYNIGFQNENFDLYFGAAIDELPKAQRADMPLNVYKSLYNRTGIRQLDKIPFFRKWFVLSKTLNKKTFIIIEDNDNGLTPEQFFKFKEGEKNKKSNPFEDGDNISFCLGDRDLINWLCYLNIISQSPAYTYFLKLKNAHKNRFPSFQKEIHFLISMLLQYEGSKAKIAKEHNIGMPELYALYYLYGGEKKHYVHLYRTILKNAYGCSRRSMITAFKFLTDMKYVEKTEGRGAAITFRITALGTQVVNEIIKSYVIL